MRIWKAKEEEEDAAFLSRYEGSSNPAFERIDSDVLFRYNKWVCKCSETRDTLRSRCLRLSSACRGAIIVNALPYIAGVT